jgi:hypothetical protein
MNQFRAGLVIFMLALTPAARAAGDCAPAEQLEEKAAPEAIADSAVRLRLVEPANGGAVDADSVLVVEVDYRVARFEPGKFGLMMYFPALVSATAPHGPEGRYELRQASGRVRLCVPLRPVYETARLRWPLSVSVTLNKAIPKSSPHFSAMFEHVAASEAVALNSVAPNRKTETLQAAVVDPEYRDAVTALTGTIVQMNALEQMCRRQPELEVEFTAALRGWTARNEPLIRQILTIQRDLYLRDMGRPEVVAEVMKLHLSAAEKALDELPADLKRAECQRYTRAFSNPRSDLETSGAAQLAVIRARTPAPLASDPPERP